MYKSALGVVALGLSLTLASPVHAYPCVVCDTENGCPAVMDPCPYTKSVNDAICQILEALHQGVSVGASGTGATAVNDLPECDSSGT